MSGPFRKLELLLAGTVYTFDRTAAEMLLARLEGGEMTDACRRMREDLRKALAWREGDDAPAFESPITEADDADEAADEAARSARPVVKTTGWPTTGGVVKAVAKENAEACGDCRMPKCRFCGQPGERAGARKDGLGRIVERYYVCKTAGCLAARVGQPQPTALFAGK